METMVTGPSRSTSTLSASVMVTLSCELSLNLAALSALDHPARHGLAVVERAGHGHVGLEIFEAGLLQCAIGRDVEGIGFAEQPLQLQPFEIDVDAAPHAFGSDPAMAALGVDDVQVHVGLFAIGDLVRTRKADRPVVRQPDKDHPGSLPDQPAILAPEALAPAFR